MSEEMTEFDFSKGDRVRLVEEVGGPIGTVTGIDVDIIYVKWPADAFNIPYRARLLRPAKPEPRTRSTTLTTAEELINGERAATYGDPEENFGRIAQLWNAQFGHKLSAKFAASDVALALVHLKLSRLAVTPEHADSWIDGCGYLALGSEIASK